MSLKSAEKFIEDFYMSPTNADLKNILKNINSKFESKETKFFYISEKAKELGFNFTAKEIEIASKNAKKYGLNSKNFLEELAVEIEPKIKKKSKIKEFLDSLL